ncbi:MAG TPA: hypothetical protein K8V15_10865 [Tessaracoccus flavescens]|uniref:Uncharacterized protein n=1 Tax=Tessaracoccus flavescens TaxID=399497 RepID=A0A921EQ40_9ACTN|nr:hypothetical protein [Tessaracoccus flavescens]
MSTFPRDHGVADLMFLYAVRELVLCYRPTLGSSLVIDPLRPRITCEGSAVVLDKTFGTWAVTVAGDDVVRLPSGPEDAALTLLELIDAESLHLTAAA